MASPGAGGTGRDALGRELTELALALADLIRQEFKASAGAGAPTFPQFKMLHAIRRGTRHVGKLAERFGISQPAASTMVDALVKDGLLKRAQTPGDRRQIELHLTAKGSARIDAIYARAFANIDGRLTMLSAAKKKAIARQIREITGVLSRADASRRRPSRARRGTRVSSAA